jgi:hypothetical protein
VGATCGHRRLRSNGLRRGNLETVINRTQTVGQLFGVKVSGHVGWGLNLALVASISLAFAGLTALVQARSSCDEVEAIPPRSVERKARASR